MAISSDRGKIFAAVGAATGLGNAFRFPAMCVKYGAAFIVAYAVILLFFCFPLLCAELSIGKNGVKNHPLVWKFIALAAACNSLFIAAYYGSICYKLGFSALSFAFFGDVNGSGVITYVLAALPLVAVFFILCGKEKAIARSGKISVLSSFALFIILAVRGLVKGGVFTSFDLSSLAGGEIWQNALGQALLSLSLAAGVMPAFAKALPQNFSVPKSAAAIIFSNLTGCVVVAVGVLPFAEGCREGGLSAALFVFPRLIYSFGSFSSVTGFLVFAVLAAVGVHSMCSLATPALSPLIKRYGVRVPFIFCVLSMALVPLMLSDGRALLNLADGLACSVFAVGISCAECLFFLALLLGRVRAKRRASKNFLPTHKIFTNFDIFI